MITKHNYGMKLRNTAIAIGVGGGGGVANYEKAILDYNKALELSPTEI